MSVLSRPVRLLHGPVEHPELDERTAMTKLGYERRTDHPWLNRTRPQEDGNPAGARTNNEPTFDDAKLTG